MKTRLVLFSRSQTHGGQILFAHWCATFLLELPAQLGVEDFARKFGLIRHSTFDHSVGDMGRKATLMEFPSPAGTQLVLDENRILELHWSDFRTTAAALGDGQDRRLLQLAVQFLASGAKLDDSVIASDYDAEFIRQLQDKLAADKLARDGGGES